MTGHSKKPQTEKPAAAGKSSPHSNIKSAQSGAKPSAKGGKVKGNDSSSAGLVPRSIVVDWLFNVLRRKRPIDELFAESEKDKAWLDLLPRDRAFARSILMTSLRHKGELEWVIGKFLKKPPEGKSRVNEILLSGAAQLLFMDVSPHAAIDMSVRLAKSSDKSRHLAKLVNAILRQLSREAADLLAKQDGAEKNIPAFWAKRWAKNYGAETGALINKAVLQPAALDLVVKDDAEGWATKLGGTALLYNSIRLNHRGLVTELEGFEDGAWWVQDFSAHLPCAFLGNLTGKRIADLCAAPGGKTASLVSQGADVTAVDISENRLLRLRDNLKRLNLKAEIVVSDIANFEPAEKFDAVLLDAPCSATGTVRRHPDILYLKNEAVIFELQKVQKQLLEKSLMLLKPGGILIYCTCSLEPEEGEMQIEALLAEHSQVKREPISSEEVAGHKDWLTKAGDVRLLPHFSPALMSGTVESPSESDKVKADIDKDSNRDIDTAAHEAHLTGMDGFFISRLRVS